MAEKETSKPEEVKPEIKKSEVKSPEVKSPEVKNPEVKPSSAKAIAANPAPEPTETSQSEPEEKTVKAGRSKIEITFNPFYKNAGIPHCPVCGEAKRTDMRGKQICVQPKKPDDCWVKD